MKKGDKVVVSDTSVLGFYEVILGKHIDPAEVGTVVKVFDYTFNKEKPVRVKFKNYTTIFLEDELSIVS